jgi:hypothetical protein
MAMEFGLPGRRDKERNWAMSPLDIRGGGIGAWNVAEMKLVLEVL